MHVADYMHSLESIMALLDGRLQFVTDEWCLYSYRIVEVGSDLYYSQPTDKGEW